MYILPPQIAATTVTATATETTQQLPLQLQVHIHLLVQIIIQCHNVQIMFYSMYLLYYLCINCYIKIYTYSFGYFTTDQYLSPYFLSLDFDRFSAFAFPAPFMSL